MQISLSGRTAVIIGASGGLGEAMAEAMGTAGARLALVGRRRDKLDALASRLAANGVDAAVFTADVTDEASVAALAAAVNAWSPNPQMPLARPSAVGKLACIMQRMCADLTLWMRAMCALKGFILTM